jgi:NDP-sugar pyrophosphorylase family protein
MHAVILAAGNGERLKPLTDSIPKPMIPIADKPVLEYLVTLCRKHGVEDISVNTSYLPKKITEHFGDGKRFGVNMRYSYEPQLLGTAGALNNFKHLIDEPFFVIYGDNITDLNLSDMLEQHKKQNAFASIYLYKERMADANTTPGRVVINPNRSIEAIIENPNEEQIHSLEAIGDELKFSNSGIYTLDNKIFDLIPQGYADFPKQVFQEVLKSGRKMYGHLAECYIREVGQMHRYLKAKEEVEKGQALKDFF